MKFIAFITILFGSACTTTNNSLQQRSTKRSLAGVWKVEQSAFRSLDSAWTFRTPPNESLYIFTKRYYSYAYVIGSNPRKLFTGDPNRPSDTEKVSAYNSFVANSGTYTLNDSTLVLRAILHKNPNEMNSHPLTYKIKVGIDKIEMTILDPPFSPGREWKTILVRIE